MAPAISNADLASKCLLHGARRRIGFAVVYLSGGAAMVQSKKSIHLQSNRIGEFGPFGNFDAQPLRECFRSHVPGLGSVQGQFRLDIGKIDCSHDFTVEPVDNHSGRARGNKYALPRAGLEAGQS